MSQHFKIHDAACPHFVTSATTHWIPVFRRDDYLRVLADALIHCTEHRELIVYAYVIMPDHFHPICGQADAKLSQVLGNLKGFTSHIIASKIEEDGREAWVRAMRRACTNGDSAKVWQDDLHAEQVHSQPFFEQKLRYTHENPVRAGFVEDSCAWKYSSAGFYYDGRASVVPVTMPEW